MIDSRRDVGLADLDRLEAPGQRRVLLDILPIFRPGRRGDGAQACRAPAPASSRLAASPVPAWPPAPISVCASSMNRMIGVGEDCTSSITERSRCSNSPFIEAPACIRPTSSTQSLTPRSGGGTSPDGDALGEAFDHRRLADAGLAGEDRIVLPPAHQHVDDLADLRRRGRGSGPSSPRLGLGGEVLAEAVERGRALRPRRGLARGVPPRRRRSRPSAAGCLRRSPSRSLRWPAASSSTGILANSCETLISARRSSSDFSVRDQHMAGADLRLAEQQRRVVPAAVERVGDLVGDARHLGLVLAEAVDDCGRVGQHAWRGRA